MCVLNICLYSCYLEHSERNATYIVFSIITTWKKLTLGCAASSTFRKILARESLQYLLCIYSRSRTGTTGKSFLGLLYPVLHSSSKYVSLWRYRFQGRAGRYGRADQGSKITYFTTTERESSCSQTQYWWTRCCQFEKHVFRSHHVTWRNRYPNKDYTHFRR